MSWVTDYDVDTEALPFRLDADNGPTGTHEAPSRGSTSTSSPPTPTTTATAVEA